MTGLNCDAHYHVILREVDQHAMRLARRHGLPRHDLEDIRQDLIADVIARAQAYDEKRASPSTFVALVAANRAALLGRRYYRERGLFGRSPVSLDEPIADDDGVPLTRGELIAEADGYAAWMGQPCDPFLETEWRLDLRAVVQLLPDRLRGLCDALATTDTAKGARRTQKRSRADHYRCRREIGLRFRAAGLASPA